MGGQAGHSAEIEPQVLWLGDPGARDTPDEHRATYVGPAKSPCPCDAGRPEDCKPEEWRPAHSPRPPCKRCGAPLYQHQGNYCRRPTPWAPRRDHDWIWHALMNPDVPWIKEAIDVMNAALDAWQALPATRPIPPAVSHDQPGGA